MWMSWSRVWLALKRLWKWPRALGVIRFRLAAPGAKGEHDSASDNRGMGDRRPPFLVGMVVGAAEVTSTAYAQRTAITMPSSGAGTRERFPVVTLFSAIFIIATVTVVRVGWGNYVVKTLGGLLAFAFLLYLFRGRATLSAEMGFYLAWVTWGLTGVFVAKYVALFWNDWQTLPQIWLMIVIIGGLTHSRKALSVHLLAFLLGVAVVGGYSWVTGEYQRAEVVGERVTGLAVNANSFGWIMLLGTVTMAYFWMLPTRQRLLKYTVLIAGMVAAVFATVMTGSRKAILGLGLFYLAWVWFCYRKQMRQRHATAFAVLLGLAVVAAGFYVLVSQTFVAERFQETWELLKGERTRGGGAERIQLYKDAWGIFLKYPILGVGMGNFILYSTQWHYSHSEYMAVLCGTGIPGFLLYFAIYVVMWRRTSKVVKHGGDPQAVRIAGLFRALLIVVLVTNFGSWNYDSKYSWIVFASFFGYLNVVRHALRQRVGEAREGPQPALSPDRLTQGGLHPGRASVS